MRYDSREESRSACDISQNRTAEFLKYVRAHARITNERITARHRSGSSRARPSANKRAEIRHGERPYNSECKQCCAMIRVYFRITSGPSPAGVVSPRTSIRHWQAAEIFVKPYVRGASRYTLEPFVRKYACVYVCAYVYTYVCMCVCAVHSSMNAHVCVCDLRCAGKKENVVLSNLTLVISRVFIE